MIDFVQQFTRNGRWGDCVDCPQLGDGTKAPELCEHTARYDHQLDAKSLVWQLERWRQSKPHSMWDGARL